MKRLLASVALGAGIAAASASASAQSVIRENASHNHLEIEVHGIAAYDAFYGYRASYGFGGGVRFNIPLLASGFLPNGNDSFALSVGADAIWWPYYYDNGFRRDAVFGINGHVDVQWNLYLTGALSMFVELGVAPEFFFCGNCQVFWFGFDFAVGLRVHFGGGNNFPALVVRAGTTGFTIGVSF